MILKLSELPAKTRDLLEMYRQLPFEHQKISCPFWMNNLKENIKGPFSGKGTPKQIVYATKLIASNQNMNLENITKEKLRKFMEKNRIGIDCSGFVFHLANYLDKENGGTGLANKLLKNNHLPSWRAAWRINADLLTSSKYTKEISLENVQSGDLIRVRGGHHVLFVVKVKGGLIIYAHSSAKTTVKEGVHLSKIEIIKPHKGLKYQNWYEQSSDGKNYSQKYFNPQDGDSIRRFIWWN